MSNLVKCEVKRVAGLLGGGAAIFLESPQKVFMIIVGLSEASAIANEIENQKPIRPLTHDLMKSMLTGFDIEIKQVIISSLKENTFCATLILEQKVNDENSQWTGKRREVQIDARASDSIIMALKTKQDIWVTQDIIEKVEDISEQFESKPTESKEWIDAQLDDIDLELPDEDGED